MKILYFSCHSVLEYDEVLLFHSMGYDVFSAGAYSNPAGHPSLPRPGIEGLKHYPNLERAASTIRATGGTFPDELIDWADTIIFMHEPEILQKNWEKLKKKRVIFRSIGQCTGGQEAILSGLVAQGLEIVRYSPMESNIPNFAGANAMIRFYKDPQEFGDWNGKNAEIINFTQSLRQRSTFCGYDVIMGATEGMPRKIYGLSNEDLGALWGGSVNYDQQRDVLRNSRVYLYHGTYPTSYTLSFIEALMTGIPVVAVGEVLGNGAMFGFKTYEIQNIIQNRKNGFISNKIDELRESCQFMLKDENAARQIGENGRRTAVELFGIKTIKDQWHKYLEKGTL